MSSRANRIVEAATLVVALALVFFLLLVARCASAHHEDAKFDIEIRQSVARHWSPCGDPCEWTWWKAQLVQESALRPTAVSPVGAQGPAQFMPSTWQDMVKRGWAARGASPFDVRPAVNAGARYMRHLRDEWSSPRPELDRMALARASYNAGLGNLLRAQKLCAGVTLYADIVTCLPQVTGHHSRETIGYEQSIRVHRRRMR